MTSIWLLYKSSLDDFKIPVKLGIIITLIIPNNTITDNNSTKVKPVLCFFVILFTPDYLTNLDDKTSITGRTPHILFKLTLAPCKQLLAFTHHATTLSVDNNVLVQ